MFDGTVSVAFVTRGAYSVGGSSNVTGNWTTITYQPQTFEVTLTKNNKPAFFTPGIRYAPTQEQIGPCTYLQEYFNDPVKGCPCNGTWTTGGFSNGVSPATRTINKTACVNATNGNSTCPEDYYFSLRPRYGNFRVRNDTNNSMRILEITRPSYNSTDGYNDTVVYANFTANFTCPPRVVGTPTSAPTTAAAAILLPSAAAFWVAFF
jgi:hypothetical protein